MQETAQWVMSVSWWLSVALAGIVFSIVAPMAKSLLGRRGGASGRNEAWRAEVEAIRSSAVRQALQVARVSHHYGRGAFFGLVSILVFLVGGFSGSGLAAMATGAIAVMLTLLGVREFRYGKASYEQMKDAGEQG